MDHTDLHKGYLMNNPQNNDQNNNQNNNNNFFNNNPLLAFALFLYRDHSASSKRSSATVRSGLGSMVNDANQSCRQTKQSRLL